MQRALRRDGECCPPGAQLTQQQVAEQLGVSAEFYSRLERGRAHPSLETFLRMLDVLGVRADTLLVIAMPRARLRRSRSR